MRFNTKGRKFTQWLSRKDWQRAFTIHLIPKVAQHVVQPHAPPNPTKIPSHSTQPPSIFISHTILNPFQSHLLHPLRLPLIVSHNRGYDCKKRYKPLVIKDLFHLEATKNRKKDPLSDVNSYGKRNKGERLVAKRLCGYLRDATTTAGRSALFYLQPIGIVAWICAHGEATGNTLPVQGAKSASRGR